MKISKDGMFLIPDLGDALGTPIACMKCGVGVLNLDTHREFHAHIDELIEWAQHISKLLSPPPAPEFCKPCKPPCCLTVEQFKEEIGYKDEGS